MRFHQNHLDPQVSEDMSKSNFETYQEHADIFISNGFGELEHDTQINNQFFKFTMVNISRLEKL